MLEGGCYCGAVRYKAEGKPLFKGQCHCRACQYISGGGPNFYMLMPLDGFAYTKGTPATFTRSDLEAPVTREFCGTCGTPIATHRPGVDAVILKVGSLDDPAAFGGPKAAIFTAEEQPFHVVAEGVPKFAGLPERR